MSLYVLETDIMALYQHVHSPVEPTRRAGVVASLKRHELQEKVPEPIGAHFAPGSLLRQQPVAEIKVQGAIVGLEPRRSPQFVW
jgi:hypothetical protein